MIINIRGTSGSGKSFVVYRLMERYKQEPLHGEDDKIKAHLIEAPWGPLYAIGKYTTPCGGCDGIPTQDEVEERVATAAAHGDVIYEGLMVGDCYLRHRDLLLRLKQPYIILFLDTPLKECISRIKARRRARGDTRPFNPNNTERRYYSLRRSIERCEQDKLNWDWLNYLKPVRRVEQILKMEKQK